ncbi:hypothetical protein J6590_037239 [Homalodisca vitripennis]|nr:hypothetical protein J6590_037239 [Homalodisca vitripennis]
MADRIVVATRCCSVSEPTLDPGWTYANIAAGDRFVLMADRIIVATRCCSVSEPTLDPGWTCWILLSNKMQTLPLETGLCWWLIASLSPDDAALCPNPPWTPDTVTHLLEIVVKQGYFYTLAHGFFIFHAVLF